MSTEEEFQIVAHTEGCLICAFAEEATCVTK